MNPKRLVYGTGAAVVVAGGLAWPGSVAFAQVITPQQARERALAAVPGTVLEVELERKRGLVAYEVEVLRNDGSVVEVLVDASTPAPTVLATAVDGDDGPFDNDGRFDDND